ncbi:MAG: hypothetical protein JXN64_07410 [Spirochaetes bacterium]|nr:hypothetical protein [Spirochaetota bacterium]
MINGIIYPEKGANGENLLREGPIVVKPKPMIYSIRADLDQGKKIKVVFPVPDDPANSWSFFRYCGMLVGWKYIPVAGGSCHEIHFWTDSPGHADLPAYFLGHNTIEIQFFENDDKNPSRTKTLSW